MIVSGVTLLSCFGIYFHQIGLPVMSLGGGSLLLAGLLISPSGRRLFSPDWSLACLLPLVCSMIVSVMRGQFDIVSWFGFAFGSAVFLVAASARAWRETFDRALRTVLVLHLVAWAAQVVSTAVGLGYLDYGKIIAGTEARYIFAAGPFLITRFTGLFEEPAHFGLFLNTLLFVRWMGGVRRLDWLDVATVLAVLTTLSASSYAFLAIVVLATGPRSLRVAALALALVTVVLVAVGFEASAGNPAQLLLLRLLNPLADPSGRLRLLGGFAEWWDSSTFDLLFGRGVGATDGLLMTNGLILGLWQLGLAGLLLLVTAVLGASTGGGFDGKVIAVVTFSLLLAPMWTNPWWWLWLALIRLETVPMRAEPAASINGHPQWA